MERFMTYYGRLDESVFAMADSGRLSSIDMTPLMFDLDIEHMRMMLDAGADVNRKFEYDRTYLMRLAGVGRIAGESHSDYVRDIGDIARMLLKAGADAYAKDFDGKTAVDYAVSKFNYPLLQAFVKYGIPVPEHMIPRIRNWKQVYGI